MRKPEKPMEAPICAVDFAMMSTRYVRAAQTIFCHTKEPKAMLAPVLHLLGQSLELLLKSQLPEAERTGQSLMNIGHNVYPLWVRNECQAVRDQMRAWAPYARVRAREKVSFGPPDTNDAVEELERAVSSLAQLHARKGSPLRYVPAKGDKGPPPHLLIFSLEPVASNTLQRLASEQ